MILKSIEIYNFKSFKDKHIIDFQQFLAVIGPNGSGKSNVFDAILFVLGTGAKKLRQQNLTELIHEGQKSCYVCVTFKNSSYAVHTNVKRSIQNNKSTFFVDEKQISGKELIEELKAKNITINPLQFVVQGEVELLAQKSPKDLVEILEDLRHNDYKKKEEEALLQYEKMKTKLENENVSNEYYKQESKQLDDRLSVLASEFKAAVKNYHNQYISLGIRKTVSMIEKELFSAKTMTLQQELSSVEKPADEALNVRKAELKGEIRLIESKLQKLTENYRHKNKGLLDITSKNRITQAKIDKQKELENSEKLRKEQYEKNNQSMKLEFDVNKRLLEDYNARMNEIKEERQKISDENLNMLPNKNKLPTWQALLKKIDSEYLQQYNILEIEAILKSFYENKTMFEEKHGKTIKNNAGLKLPELLAKLQSDYERIRIPKNTHKLTEQIKQCEKNYNELKTDRYDTAAELEKTKLQLGTSDVYEQRILTSLKSIDGFYGKASSLYVIDEKYIVASLAAGKAYLNSFVVDTTQTAEKCIDILKTKNFGRQNFLVLDKIRPKTAAESKSGKILYKLVSCDTTFKNLFSFIFGDTYVFETKDDAYSAAFNDSKRAVTLDGQLIDKSGLMSGGGYNFDKTKLRKKIDVLSNALTEIDKQMQKALEQLNEHEIMHKEYIVNQNKRCTLGEEIKELKRRIQEQEDKDYDKITQQYNDMCNKLVLVEDVYKRKQQENEENLPLANKKLNAEMSILFDKITQLHSRNDELQNEIATGTYKSILIKPVEYELIECDSIQKSVDEMKAAVDEHEHKRNKVLTNLKEVEKELINTKLERQRQIEQEVAITNQINDYRERLEQTNKFLELYKQKVTALKFVYDQLFSINTKMQELKSKFAENKGTKYNKEAKYLNDHDETVKNKNILNDEIEKICAFTDPDNTDDFVKYLYEQINAYKDSKNTNLDYQEIRTIIEKRLACFDAQTYYHNIQLECDNAMQMLQKVQKERSDNLMDIYKTVNASLKRIYQQLTKTGLAELELIDYLDPFQGFAISVMPPKKSWRTISFLSGGEKTITSLSLLFALHSFAELPFFVFDEIDAALDHSNVEKVGNYLCSLSSQILIVSLREKLFEQANCLLGIYKVKGETKTVQLNVNLVK